MSALDLVEPGFATSLQDFGRRGYQRFGTPPAGALDRDALTLANALVGAPAGQAALEMRFLGPSFEVAAESVRVALVGAEVAMRREPADGGEAELIGADRSALLKRGDRLKVGALRGSATAYLAIEGGFDAAPVLGSQSFFARGGFGGFFGRPIQAGDRLPLAAAEAQPLEAERILARPFDFSAPARARVVLGPQDDYFAPEAIERFLATEWRLSANIDRMGLRLEGATIAAVKGHDIVSDGIATGAIQVPGSGQPILLLKDRGTAGGYPKIATVISADIGALGRLAPGASLGFWKVTPEEGVAIARQRAAEIKAMIGAIRPLTPEAAIDLEQLYEANLVTAVVEHHDD